ncbi:hypothetical protein HMPREF3293_01621 [Christensenella minuta]|uniref:Uncharacterized protein n=1 Tax=Christensenella minuta TaxID=626937 RepID=A0A136Q421_9FIRM|nr:hypothetical protein HMPREF3293_01621 [Christensenella minuta]
MYHFCFNPYPLAKTGNGFRSRFRRRGKGPFSFLPRQRKALWGFL